MTTNVTIDAPKPTQTILVRDIPMSSNPTFFWLHKDGFNTEELMVAQFNMAIGLNTSRAWNNLQMAGPEFEAQIIPNVHIQHS